MLLDVIGCKNMKKNLLLLFQKKVASAATVPVAPQKKLGPETDA